MKKIKLLIIPILILILCGCGKKCIKSHQETGICSGARMIGKRVYPYTYPCPITVCDEYEEDKECPNEKQNNESN